MEEADEAREELKLFLFPSSAFTWKHRKLTWFSPENNGIDLVSRRNICVTWLGLLGRLGLFSARGGSGLLAGFSGKPAPPPIRDRLLASSWTIPPDLLKACSWSAGFTGGGCCFSGKTPDLLFACFLLSSSNQLGLAWKSTTWKQKKSFAASHHLRGGRGLLSRGEDLSSRDWQFCFQNFPLSWFLTRRSLHCGGLWLAGLQGWNLSFKRFLKVKHWLPIL